MSSKANKQKGFIEKLKGPKAKMIVSIVAFILLGICILQLFQNGADEKRVEVQKKLELMDAEEE